MNWSCRKCNAPASAHVIFPNGSTLCRHCKKIEWADRTREIVEVPDDSSSDDDEIMGVAMEDKDEQEVDRREITKQEIVELLSSDDDENMEEVEEANTPKVSNMNDDKEQAAETALWEQQGQEDQEDHHDEDGADDRGNAPTPSQKRGTQNTNKNKNKTTPKKRVKKKIACITPLQFRFMPMWGYYCISCTCRNAREDEFKRHLREEHGLYGDGCNQIMDKLEKDMVLLAEIQLIDVEFAKIEQKSFLKLLNRGAADNDDGTRSFCYTCMKIAHESKCKEHEKEEVKCYVIQKCIKDKRKEQSARPLELFDKGKLHTKYMEILERVKQRKSRTRKYSTPAPDNDFMTVTVGANVLLDEEPPSFNDLNLPRSMMLSDCSRLASLLTASNEDIEKLPVFDQSKEQFHVTFQNDIDAFFLSEISEVGLQFMNRYYKNLCVENFEGSLSRLARYYCPLLMPAKDPREITITAIVPPLLHRLHKQLEEFNPFYQQELNRVSTVSEYAAYHRKQPFGINTPHDEVEKLSVPNNFVDRRKLLEIFNVMILYTVRKVKEKRRDQWLEFCNVKSDEEKMLYLCQWINHLSKVSPRHRSERKTDFADQQTFYGAFALAYSLNLNSIDKAADVWNTETPRKLQTTLRYTLLCVKLCAITWDPSQNNEDGITLHKAMSNCITVHDLSSMLKLVPEFILKKQQEVDSEIVPCNDGTGDYFITTTLRRQKMTTFRFPYDLRNSCNMIRDSFSRLFFETINLVLGAKSNEVCQQFGIESLNELGQNLYSVPLLFKDSEYIFYTSFLTEPGSTHHCKKTRSLSFRFQFEDKSFDCHEIMEIFHSSCKGDSSAKKRINCLVNFFNVSSRYIATILYTSFPADPPSLETLSSMCIGSSDEFPHDVASIATVPTKGKLLQMKLTSTEHYIPDEISRMIALQLLLRNLLVRLLHGRMEASEILLHKMSYFFLVELVEREDSWIVQQMNKRHVRTALEKELNIQFDIIGHKEFTVTQLQDAKHIYFEKSKHKLYPDDNVHTTTRAETFGHSRYTHRNQYSMSNRSSFGNRLNSRYNKEQLKMDKAAYKMCNLSISDADTTKNTFLQDKQFQAIAKADLTGLYKSFINSDYEARDEEMPHVNEIVTRLRTSIHVLPCGFGKTSLYLVPAAINLLTWILTTGEDNVLESVSNIIDRRKNDREHTNDVDMTIIAAQLEKLKRTWDGPKESVGCCTLILVPVVSLARALEDRISKSNLIMVKGFERNAFVKEMIIHRNRRDFLPTVDVWICTYTKASVHMDLIRTAAKTGYLREVVYDEAHSFFQQFLTFHQNLKIVMLRTVDIPIICVTGTLAKSEERQLQELVADVSGDEYKFKELSRKFEDVSGDEYVDEFEAFKVSKGIHRCRDTMPRNLKHCIIQPRALKSVAVLTLVSGVLEDIFNKGTDARKKEVGNVIVFLPTIGHVQQMKRIFDAKGLKAVTLTGKHTDKGEQQQQVDEFVSKWINGEDVRIALCTTAASLGIDNEKCRTVISIGVYYGLSNYVQCASRAARSQTEQGRSIFIASSKEDYDVVDGYYTHDDDAKMERLKTYGALEPSLDKNESLRKIVGPFTAEETQHKKMPCVHCQLTRHFDGREAPAKCDHGNNSDDSRILLSLKKALELPITE